MKSNRLGKGLGALIPETEVVTRDETQENFTEIDVQRIKPNLFIILDTELDNGSIEGEQFEMVRYALIESAQEKADNIFIFSPFLFSLKIYFRNICCFQGRTCRWKEY